MARNHEVMQRKLRWGMIGGGPGAFIGEVHRKAAAIDGQVELMAGAFDIDPRKSRQMGRELYLPSRRVYRTWEEMVEEEAKLPPGERLDFISICTPNFTHFPIAKAFLQAGFHVVCEKPMTMDVKQARDLVKVVKASGNIFGLMHNYTGYPMVKLARDMVAGGEIGAVRKIKVQYAQGWLATALEKTGQQQASWRTDPKRAGAAGCMGDIGTHAENLAEYITGLRMVEICADLTRFVKGRKLDDDGNCLVRWQKGVRGVLTASQVSIGEENGLAIWIYGDKGGLEWHQEHPNHLYVKRPDTAVEIWRRGNPYVAERSPAAGRATRLPCGHPEAFLEAFANIYANVVDTIRARIARVKPDPLARDFPTVQDGLRGMEFIAAVVKSSARGARWVKLG